jgi:hypothetical protein
VIIACPDGEFPEFSHQSDDNHFADDYVVVTAIVDRMGAAFETGQRARQKRRSIRAVRIFNVAEQRVIRFREMRRHIGLVRRQDIDREMPGIDISVQRIGNLGDIPQDQRRIQRHRTETVGRYAVRIAVLIGTGDDSNAGGKLPEALAERFGISHILAHICRLSRGPSALDNSVLIINMLMINMLTEPLYNGNAGVQPVLAHDAISGAGCSYAEVSQNFQ